MLFFHWFNRLRLATTIRQQCAQNHKRRQQPEITIFQRRYFHSNEPPTLLYRTCVARGSAIAHQSVKNGTYLSDCKCVAKLIRRMMNVQTQWSACRLISAAILSQRTDVMLLRIVPGTLIWYFVLLFLGWQKVIKLDIKGYQHFSFSLSSKLPKCFLEPEMDKMASKYYTQICCICKNWTVCTQIF